MRLLKQVMAVMGTVTMIAMLIAVVAPQRTHALVAALVQVTNSVSNPVATEEALGTATILEAQCAAGSLFFCYIVPADKRAVIEHVDGQCIGSPGSAVSSLRLFWNQADSGLPHIHPLPMTFETTPAVLVSQVFSLPLRDYAAPGTVLKVSGTFLEGPTGGPGQCSVGIYGRLVPIQ